KNFYEKEYGINLDELLIPLENLLTNLKLMINGNLTLSGLLLFGKKPERIRPQYIVRAVSFFGNELGDSNYLDSLVVPYMSSIKGQWVL
ncbi:MAG: hypothetical protein QME46_02210, partial [Thermoanaerobacteraceae bacterium]|nr:hypothetical protein [Thermoanaerobacteraceae bacterium]